ncbi:MAG: TIGR03790 family protein [Desulfobacca sp.]|uniref:TIGR03790 family protein n=1 Tax=Desulfobacca sp. TaxID=2067990 RepID=UPI004049C06B
MTCQKRVQLVRRRAGGILLATLLLWQALPATPALALAPEDLILVYNLNLPESRAVARYYAAKRQVPLANLVGVNAPTTENISRADYELVLAEPLRQQVRQFQSQGRQPVLLLVYGIPLRVDDPLFSHWFNLDQDFLNLAQGKVQELQELCWRLAGQLAVLLEGQQLATEVPPFPGVIQQIKALVSQAAASLQEKSSVQGFDTPRHAILRLLIQLAGSEPEFEAFKKQLIGRGAGPLPPLPPQLQQFALLRAGQEEAAFRGILPETALELAPSIRHSNGLLGELQFWQRAVQLYQNPQTKAAVDSELTLLLAEPYQKAQWLPNPFLARFDQLPFISGLRRTTLMVGRLDGPSPEIAQRLVDDALAAEASGLEGTFYIDARGLTDAAGHDAYAHFDGQLRQLHDFIRRRTSLPVVLDNQPELFPAGAGLKAALYVGWYSLAQYIDAFAWQRGAVAYHVASAECVTLRHKSANVWCKRLLEHGVAATLGPVAEPYLHSFPAPAEFFPLLLSGRLPLLEVYFRTIPQVSWRQILIGDPLYQPFRTRPALNSAPEKTSD